MKRKTITKEWLQSLGVTNVTEEGKITYKGEIAKEVVARCKHKHGKDKTYPIVGIYDPKLYHEQKEAGKKNTPGQRFLLVSRIVYAWFNDVCPAEYDVDHIDNNPFNNNLSNLQLLTRKENLNRHVAKNQYTCNLSDEVIMFRKHELDFHNRLVEEARIKRDEEKRKLKEIENELKYYEQLCKKIEEYNLFKEVKKDFKERLEFQKAKLEEATDNWHFRCYQKKTHLEALKSIK